MSREKKTSNGPTTGFCDELRDSQEQPKSLKTLELGTLKSPEDQEG